MNLIHSYMDLVGFKQTNKTERDVTDNKPLRYWYWDTLIWKLYNLRRLWKHSLFFLLLMRDMYMVHDRQHQPGVRAQKMRQIHSRGHWGVWQQCPETWLASQGWKNRGQSKALSLHVCVCVFSIPIPSWESLNIFDTFKRSTVLIYVCVCVCITHILGFPGSSAGK